MSDGLTDGLAHARGVRDARGSGVGEEFEQGRVPVGALLRGRRAGFGAGFGAGSGRFLRRSGRDLLLAHQRQVREHHLELVVERSDDPRLRPQPIEQLDDRARVPGARLGAKESDERRELCELTRQGLGQRLRVQPRQQFIDLGRPGLQAVRRFRSEPARPVQDPAETGQAASGP
ncbi:hypothetical protein [Streptomyces boetiae]|uniref:hypothetical protein n=1 Tax=Streptomyces boetiae TaxID=3075541 RepID=UPI00374E0C70